MRSLRRPEDRTAFGPRYHEDEKDITLGDYSGIWAAGGVVATAADVARFFDALFNTELISASALDDMTASRERRRTLRHLPAQL